jgi:hypothetical protein
MYSTVRNCYYNRQANIFLRSYTPVYLITDALLATALRKHDHIANAFLSGLSNHAHFKRLVRGRGERGGGDEELGEGERGPYAIRWSTILPCPTYSLVCDHNSSPLEVQESP